MGPSWYWMPDVFDRFFSDFNKKSTDLYEIKKLDPVVGWIIWLSKMDHIMEIDCEHLKITLHFLLIYRYWDSKLWNTFGWRYQYVRQIRHSKNELFSSWSGETSCQCKYVGSWSGVKLIPITKESLPFHINSSSFSNFFRILLASSIASLSLLADCFSFSARAFFAEIVASIAFPCGIKKFLP